MRLGERFNVWPLATPPGQITAAQAMVLAESLKEKPARDAKRPSGVRNQPRVQRDVLRKLAEKNNSLDGSR